MKTMWISSERCTGCGACADACPQKAIIMKADECGFIHPHITNACVECNLCEKVCLARGKNANKHYYLPLTYAAWSKNSDVRFHSTSGGIFSELATVILNQGGMVAGAQYKNNMVEHTLISSTDDLYRIRQSKYTQSNPNGIYLAIKRQLKTGKTVLFCGAPCQVAGLYAYLGEDYSNLITIDFICRGMNSPKAYLSWLTEIEKKEKSKITRVWFKYKDGGWKTSPKRTRLDFQDGHYIIKNGTENLFMHGYLALNLYIRQSCGDCSFKGVPRQGDLTLADFWGIEQSLDDDKGTSIILINSDKGLGLFDSTKSSLHYVKREFDEIFAGNICFSQSVSISKYSQAFLHSLDKVPFSVAINRYMRIVKIKRFIKKMLRK